MATSASLLRCLCRRNNTMVGGSGVIRRWINTTSTSAGSGGGTSCTSTLPSRVSPWLMLGGPKYDENPDYNFFSFKENRTITFSKSFGAPGSDIEPHPVYKGCSHGWLIWISIHNCDIFLTNPVTGRQIRLPSIFPLFGETVERSEHFIPLFNQLGEEGNRASYPHSIFNVILSSSPDDPDSDPIALMIYGVNHHLAFCRLNDDDKWIPLDDSMNSDHMVYSSKDQVFYSCYMQSSLDKWDLRDPCAPPKKTAFEDVDVDGVFLEESEGELTLTKLSSHLVIDPSGDVLLVQRYVIWTNETVVDDEDWALHETKRFRVYKIYPGDDDENNKVEYLSDTLPDNCVLFVGKNHSFSLKASDFPEFIPNSIYFTDYGGILTHGNHDIEIYNYGDKSISSCYIYPPANDLSKIQFLYTCPMWITPNPGF